MARLTPREKKLLDMIVQSKDVKTAAYFLRYHENPKIRDEAMTDDAAYSMLRRIRIKYLASRQFINTILAYRRKDPKLKQVLTPRIRVEEEDEE